MELKNEIKRETSNVVAKVRADNGKGEFGPSFQLYLKEQGIHFEPGWFSIGSIMTN
jgi:hypothetical protein